MELKNQIVINQSTIFRLHRVEQIFSQCKVLLYVFFSTHICNNEHEIWKSKYLEIKNKQKKQSKEKEFNMVYF